MAFILTVEEELLNNKFNGQHDVIDQLKILQDICEFIEICIPKEFTLNFDELNPFENICREVFNYQKNSASQNFDVNLFKLHNIESQNP